ncbi:unannotated protein [freshwater metagenome]|uniref:Unannotated protein n=1 Tax=freshwater metagenome TaxID=449393 RepID=A0A6J6P840_9ZZZZ
MVEGRLCRGHLRRSGALTPPPATSAALPDIWQLLPPLGRCDLPNRQMHPTCCAAEQLATPGTQRIAARHQLQRQQPDTAGATPQAERQDLEPERSLFQTLRVARAIPCAAHPETLTCQNSAATGLVVEILGSHAVAQYQGRSRRRIQSCETAADCLLATAPEPWQRAADDPRLPTTNGHLVPTTLPLRDRRQKLDRLTQVLAKRPSRESRS